ncbi:Flotillin-like protein 1 [Mactra antiquata]
MGFETCGPNEVMVVSGCCRGNSEYIPGGRVFVWPVIQRLQRMTLNTMTLMIESPMVYTKFGVAISVTGIAQMRYLSV